MTTKELIAKLVSRCKGEISITINPHTANYETIKDYITYQCTVNNQDISKEKEDRMIAANTIIEVQAYPDTPVGFYLIFHHDIDLALKEMLELIVE